MKDLYNALQAIGKLPDSGVERFAKLARQTKIVKGGYFICEGDRTNKLGLVKQGLFRSVSVSQGGVECTFDFSSEGDFIYECHAMRTSAVAEYSVQAIEDAVIWEVDYKQWAEPFQDSAWWNKILLALTTSELNQKRVREIELMQFNGKQRYAYFLEKYATLEPRIKQHIVSSYLGITPISLSRIRKQGI